MTIRDYFAAHALIGLLAEPFTEGMRPEVQTLAGAAGRSCEEMYAMAAYKLADAMLKERGK